MKKFSIVSIILGLLLIVSPLTQPLLAQHAVHWTYEGAEGPEHWGDLSPDFVLCGTGTEQSPIDIPADAPENPNGITFHYQSAPLSLVNNGHTIQVVPPAGSSITLNGKTYNLIQYHFHIPSEHELGGAHTDMEVHFVHEAADGAVAVVGVMFVQGAENAAYAPVFSNLPKTEQPATVVEGVTVDTAALLPADHARWSYAGSLTTPPCTQGLNWNVLSTPVELSQAQIDAFKAIFPENARPIQELDGRTFVSATLPNTGGDIFSFYVILVSAGVVLVAGGVGIQMVSRRKNVSH